MVRARRKRLRYDEGDWFAVPLPSGGYALGVVARVRRGILLGYFFRPRRKKIPVFNKRITSLSASDAILCSLCGDLGIIEGEWPILGKDPNWDRKRWPMPIFTGQDPLSEVITAVRYDESTLQEVDSYRVAELGEHADGLAGSGFVEELLDARLGGQGRRGESC